MKKSVFAFASLLATLTFLFLIGCGGKKWDHKSGEELRSDTEFMYAEAFATSRSLEMATGKAEGLARAKLSQQIKTNVDALFKLFIQEVGGGDDTELLGQTTIVTKSVSSNVLRGSRPAQTKWRRTERGFEAYALMELPLGADKIDLLQGIQNDTILYERFRAAQGFQELKEDVEEMKAKDAEKYNEYMQRQGSQR